MPKKADPSAAPSPSDEIGQHLPLMNNEENEAVANLAPAIQAEFQKWNDAWAAVAKDLAPQLAEWNRLTRDLAARIAPVIRAYSDALKSVAPLVAAFARREAESKRLDDAGWLPHYTTPFELVESPDLTPSEVDQILGEYYSNNWSTVRADFLRKLAGYDVDDIAKDALREALECHEAGRYRSAIALLFIEIERLVRHELHAGEVGGIASLKKLRELAGSISPSDTELGGIPGLWLFKKLGNHLYAPIKSDEELTPYALSPVPNRHAAVHGLVVYRTAQSSLNTLFMADYIYQVINAAKRSALALEAESSGGTPVDPPRG